MGSSRQSPHRARRTGKRPRTRAEYDQERSAETRLRILTAAFESLYEVGLTGTTTVEIAERAGAPRGTLLHHFPTREALMVAALEHVFQTRLDEFTSGMAALADDSERQSIDEAIDLLWEAMTHGRSTVVWLELLIGARTHPALHRELTQMMRTFDERIDSVLQTFFPHDEGQRLRVSTARRFAFALLNGLVLDWIAGYQEHIDPVIETLKTVMRQIDRRS